MKILEHVPLAPMTTFKIGGTARFLTKVSNEDELLDALVWAESKNIEYCFLAGGSNILISDTGFDGLVINLNIHERTFDGASVFLGAGNVLWNEILYTCNHGLAGWENLAGIPGSIGGAVRGNSGAFGVEIGDLIVSVRFYNTATKTFGEMKKEACDFGYRSSVFKKHPDLVIVRVALKLKNCNASVCCDNATRIVSEREKRHIQNVKAAGSYFINPITSREIQKMFEKEKEMKSRGGRVPAGWLIEKMGCKGVRVGGAIASKQHPNYIVNIYGATAKDVRKLAQKIKKTAFDHFGVELQEEVSHIGERE